MKMHISLIQDEFIKLFNLRDLVNDQGFLCMDIRGGMHGLSQAGRLAHDEFVTHLAPFGHSPVRFAPDLWMHKQINITFTLAVENFSIKCLSPQYATHLKEADKTKHTATVDHTGSLHVGVVLD